MRHKNTWNKSFPVQLDRWPSDYPELSEDRGRTRLPVFFESGKTEGSWTITLWLFEGQVLAEFLMDKPHSVLEPGDVLKGQNFGKGPAVLTVLEGIDGT